MRKGDERKQAILSASERLFCKKGYDATSIQDILDELHVSKGGFYHHFSSKEEVLNQICVQRAERRAQQASELLNEIEDTVERLNAVLRQGMPLIREELPFMTMLLPLMEQMQGRALAFTYNAALEKAMLPLLERAVTDGYRAGVLAPQVHDVEPILMHLLTNCWLDVAWQIIEWIHKGWKHDCAVLAGILEKYRRTVEVLLDAPYGSIQLIALSEWDEAAEQLMNSLGVV